MQQTRNDTFNYKGSANNNVTCLFNKIPKMKFKRSMPAPVD